MSNIIATKRVDLMAPYMQLSQFGKVQAECKCHKRFMLVARPV
jgi:hypothetical protein